MNSEDLTPCHSRTSRLAFTLLEIVLALGLTSLLLAAVYSAMQMHWSYSQIGQVEMERSQVARALFRRIETDLRSVVFRSAPLSSSDSASSSSSSTGSTTSGSTPNTGSSGSGTPSASGSSAGSPSTSSSTGSSTSGNSPSSSSTGTTTAPEEKGSTQKTGLSGDSASLVVHVSLPSRANSGLAAASANSPTAGVLPSDLQSIAYFLAGSSSPLAQQLSGSLTNAAPVRSGQPSGGLARMQGDRMAMQAADESGDLSTMAGNVKLLAPEVAAIQFEFFDGVSWTSEWDSGVSNSLPNAVRVIIDFHPPDTSRAGWFARPVSQSSNRFHQVIALPLAEPYIPAAS